MCSARWRKTIARVRTILFVCTRNRLRSPTAEQVFASYSGVEVGSAGTLYGCPNPLTHELVEWSDLIVVMGRAQRAEIQRRFRRSLKATRIVCLDVPDVYAFMDPALVDLLERRMARHLG